MTERAEQLLLPLPGLVAPEPSDLGIAHADRVFVNRNLRLSRIEWVGFDMDYTLAVYDQARMDALSVELTVERMLARGYPESLRAAHYEPRFPIRGLLIDKVHGNVLKLDRYKVVQKGYHGLTPLARDVVRELYRERQMRPETSSYRWIDTLFELAEVTAFVAFTDALESRGERVDPRRLFDDIRASIDEAHRDGTVYGAVSADFSRFVERDLGLARTMHKLRSAGKRLFLLTNSPAHYTEKMMDYLLGSALPEYPSWHHYFDVAICSACKPAWFRESNPFLERDGEAKSLERGRVYQGGNLADFERMTGARGHTVLYVGDHIYGDILRSKKESTWRTAMIIPELGQELAAHAASAPLVLRQRELEAERARCEDEKRYHQARWKDRTKHASVEDAERTALQRVLARLRGELRAVDAEHRALTSEIDRCFHPYWGSLLKDGHEMSLFGVQVDMYADIYMRRVSCLERYSPEEYFRSPHDLMPHEL